MAKLDLSNATFIGEGPWIKDSAYQVYLLDDKYYTVIVHDSLSKYMLEETIQEIGEHEIGDYI